jgi:hypothetical protein
MGNALLWLPRWLSRHWFAASYLTGCYIFWHWVFSLDAPIAGDAWMQFVVGSLSFLLSLGVVVGVKDFGRFF